MPDTLKSEYLRYLPKEFQDFGDRDIVWLWSFLKNKGEVLAGQYENNVNSLAIDMGRLLRKKDSNYIQGIKEARLTSMVEEECLDFIDKKDKRLLSFLINTLSKKYGYALFLDINHYVINDWHYLLLLIDGNNFNVDKKKQDLRECQETWLSNLYMDRSLTWLDEKNFEQSTWILNQAENYRMRTFVPGSINSPVDSKGMVQKFKCILDQSDLSKEMKRAFVSDLKRKWQAKGRIKSEGKVQSNVLVRKETKERIKSLQREYGFKSRGDVIDKLVNDAFLGEG